MDAYHDIRRYENQQNNTNQHRQSYITAKELFSLPSAASCQRIVSDHFVETDRYNTTPYMKGTPPAVCSTYQ